MTGREAALEALERCRKDGAWSGLVLDRTIRKGVLEPREAALASRLFLGVLQNSACCDYYIDLYRASGKGALQPKLRSILRLGAYQLLFMDRIPARAAVSESVALCRSVGLDRAAGLVNALLRRLSDALESLPPIPGEGTAEYLSIRYSHPLWLCQWLVEVHGYAFAEGFLKANNAEPELCIQVNTLKISAAEYGKLLAEQGFACRTDEVLHDCLFLRGVRVEALPGFDEGLFYVQDRAARLAVTAAAPEPGMRVLDACAAPGGKSFAAAIAMGDAGSVSSWDIHENKLTLVRRGAERLGVSNIYCFARDARTRDESLRERFDLVLADLPCSGFGVIRKRPEIRYKTREEIAALPEIQKSILDNLADLVRPEGLLLYSTCTIFPWENQDQVRDFLAEHRDFHLEPFRAGGVEAESGMYSFWPHIDNCDGFFIAKLRRGS